MRPELPIEDHAEVLEYAQIMLPGLDSELVKEIADDYMLAALVCVDFDDLNSAIIQPGTLFTDTKLIHDIECLPVEVKKLFENLLFNHYSDSLPEAVLLWLRVGTDFSFEKYKEALSEVRSVLPERRTFIHACFVDPDSTETRIRLFTCGKLGK